MDTKDLPKYVLKKLNRFSNTCLYRELGLARTTARSGQFDRKKYENSNWRLRIRMNTKDLPKHELKKLDRFSNTYLYHELGLAETKARSG